MSARTWTPYCPRCDRFFRFGPHPSRCPMCEGPIDVRDIQFEQTCQAMPQDSNVTRQLAQANRHARARANA